MQLLKTLKVNLTNLTEFDVTIFQTPSYGETKGYREVYRLRITGNSHEEVLEKVFTRFNIRDRMPEDYFARYITTGDIVFIDEGRNGHHYYQLKIGGWKPIHRFHIH